MLTKEKEQEARKYSAWVSQNKNSWRISIGANQAEKFLSETAEDMLKEIDRLRALVNKNIW